MSSGRRRSQRHAFLADLVDTIPIIPYDLAVAEAHAELLLWARRSGRPRGAHDLIIAATALASGRIVVTEDARGFTELLGLEVRAAL